MIDRIAFILGEAVAGIRRNVGMSLISVATAAVALFLLGGIYFLAKGLESAAQELTGKFDMLAYLQEGATDAEMHETIKEIRAIPGVASVQWIPRDKAWERQKEELKLSFSEGMPNPLPDAYKVILSDLKSADQIAATIGALPKIDKKRGVGYLKQEQKTVERGRSFLRWAGGALGTMFLSISGVLIFNTTRLAIANRRAEIRIMRLVGAHWLMVDVPFLVEGIVFGTMGGVLATGALSLAYVSVGSQVTALTASSGVIVFPYVPAMQALSLVGAAFGFVCAALALWIPERKPKK
ncbi:permease-like cell division protein FtsX [soil metagenome]